jgi:hypothetical protein
MKTLKNIFARNIPLLMEILWEKIQFWKKNRNMYKENVDFVLHHLEEQNLTTVEILLQEYKGVKYHYLQARIVEDEGLARLQYGYTILESGEHDIDDLNSDEEFFIIMGDILQEILLKQIEYDEQTGTNNTQKFDLQ